MSKALDRHQERREDATGDDDLIFGDAMADIAKYLPTMAAAGGEIMSDVSKSRADSAASAPQKAAQTAMVDAQAAAAKADAQETDSSGPLHKQAAALMTKAKLLQIDAAAAQAKSGNPLAAMTPGAMPGGKGIKPESGMSTGTVIALGVGGASVLGLVLYLIFKKK